MDIAPLAQTPAQAGSAATGTAAAPAAISSDFETFIRMLTVQMRNQDPLNPIESADFAVQLATFSTVEQQVRTNDLLTSLGDRLGALNMAQLSGWVGMEARAEIPVAFDGAPVTLTVEGSRLAETAQLVVHDAAGKEVQRQAISSDRQQIEWAGAGQDGTPLPPGLYDITVESFSQDSMIATSAAQVHGRVVEARNQDGRALLVLDTGQEVPSEDILGLRQPD